MVELNFYQYLMIVVFVIGYLLITIEHVSRINKTSIALLTGILCWTLQFASQAMSKEANLVHLNEHMADISQIIFFLFGALTIVEIINAHKGFKMLSDNINLRSKCKFMWMVGLISFFLSSILDNLTTTIVMVSLIQKMIADREDRLLIGGVVVIAANAGGAWTPIGDVTTTMLWIGGQVSTLEIIKALFIPSFVCLIGALSILSFKMKGNFIQTTHLEKSEPEPMGRAIFWIGIGSLIFVPCFKVVTGLPPFMGMIFGLGLMWLFTDLIHKRHGDRDHLRVPNIMTNIDVTSVLFFLGILLSIDALQTAGLLEQLARWMDHTIANSSLIAIAIGLASAVVDNVPLVAATMGMYSLKQYPMDSSFWNLIAYCAGTGGSVLIIGSAAGVAFMGLEKVEFFWYFKRIGFSALVGYFAGIGIFQLLS